MGRRKVQFLTCDGQRTDQQDVSDCVTCTLLVAGVLARLSSCCAACDFRQQVGQEGHGR